MTIDQASILKSIKDGANTYGDICKALDVKPNNKAGRVIDRELQKARKAGLVTYSRKTGWQISK